jgi:hypothetical protein
LQGCDRPVTELLRLFSRRCRTDDEHEFVTTDARHRIDVAHQPGQAPRNLAQQFIARTMTQRIVDELEPVEIENQHGERLAIAIGMRNRLRKSIVEQHAVGQARERIVTCHVPQLPVGRFEPRGACGHDLFE